MTLTQTIQWILDTRPLIRTMKAEAALIAAAEAEVALIEAIQALQRTIRTEYIWNDRRDGLAHIVINVDNFALYGDAATYCGDVAWSAEFGGAEFPVCLECVAAFEADE